MMIKIPKTLAAELTYRCNHKCIFCSCPWEANAGLKSDELTTEQWKDALLTFRKQGLETVTFTGGEPTLREDLLELVDYAKGVGLDVGLITNGRIVNDVFLKKLKPFDVQLSISVPGIDTFKETTGVDNIEHVLSLFGKAKELGIKTVANIAVTKKNLSELYENIAMPVINGATYVLLNRFLPGGRGLENKEYLLSLDEINEMFKTAEKVLKNAGISGHVGTEMPYCAIYEPKKYKHLQIASKCSAAKNFFTLDPGGYIKVCNHSPRRLMRYTELAKLNHDSYWETFACGNYIPKMCEGCEHLNEKCDGGCREAAHCYYGAVDAPDPCICTVSGDNNAWKKFKK